LVENAGLPVSLLMPWVSIRIDLLKQLQLQLPLQLQQQKQEQKQQHKRQHKQLLRTNGLGPLPLLARRAALLLQGVRPVTQVIGSF